MLHMLHISHICVGHMRQPEIGKLTAHNYWHYNKISQLVTFHLIFHTAFYSVSTSSYIGSLFYGVYVCM